MNIQLSTVHFTADQKLIDFVNKKVPKLDTYFEGIIGAEVILKVVKPETANNKVAEIKLLCGWPWLVEHVEKQDHHEADNQPE